ncbi:hypothetical protein AGIG_G7767 [Arapaima gigas]
MAAFLEKEEEPRQDAERHGEQRMAARTRSAAWPLTPGEQWTTDHITAPTRDTDLGPPANISRMLFSTPAADPAAPHRGTRPRQPLARVPRTLGARVTQGIQTRRLRRVPHAFLTDKGLEHAPTTLRILVKSSVSDAPGADGQLRRGLKRL